MTSFTSPSLTLNVGDPGQAADWNTYVRDNTTFLYSAPKVRVYNSANISVTSSTDTALTFDTERFDTDTMHSTSTNTSRITFTTAGTYLVGANVEWASDSTSYRELTLRLNGSTKIGSSVVQPSSSVVTRQTVTTVYAFQIVSSVADYVEAVVRHVKGSALNVVAAGNYSPEFYAIWMSS